MRDEKGKRVRNKTEETEEKTEKQRRKMLRTQFLGQFTCLNIGVSEGSKISRRGTNFSVSY